MQNPDTPRGWVFLLPTLFIAVAHAGDTRTVSQPVPPQPCQVLHANGTADSTQNIQHALDTCGSGKAVHLSPTVDHPRFYSGPLTLPSGVSLWVDNGAFLFAIANPSRYDTGHHTCGTLDASGKGCNPFIWIKNAVGSGIYGQGTIDGQGNATMIGKSKTWWQLATDAKNKHQKQNAPRLIQIDNSKNITLYQITLKNSPNFHIASNKTNGLTLWAITINTPASARNTDGVDPMGSTNVTLARSNISTGDDNVAIKAGNAASSHISILNNHFGFGHGMSIGSEVNQGVSDVTVSTLTLNGTTNGLRIKSDPSRGGLVSGVTYDNVCMENVKHPIVLDTHYDSTASGSLIPEFRDITFNNVRVLTAGSFSIEGYSNTKPISVRFNNLHIKKGSVWHEKYAIIQGKAQEDATGSCE
ncbi:glycosyl hydrolase family 28 protein [Acerihabitans sp. TG2]|uniref:glycoside hydrolase family 28 protein n=1 Tax=Acerihabitans sp. TG2 TaxID=3096008 RepID=UPI002B224A6C|nr:glycosyl hydrolase family 28 protein [Acerihabitans sp. TG2]MEA9391584.1 glycosyl hydrolase family 28 protein [Acerihabitans sp. TG2]